jgi:hypothetical protein
MAVSSIAGKDFVLTVGGKPFGCAQDVSISITTTTTDTVGCRGDVQVVGGSGLVPTNTKPTGYSWTVTPGALFRFPSTPTEAAAMVTIPQMQKIQIAGTPLEMVFKYTDASGYEIEYAGTAYITDSTLDSPLDGDSTGSFTFTGSGDLAIDETLPA